MASALDTKINSYAIERGYEFSEAISTNPTRTGSNTGTAVLSLTNAGTGLTFEPNDGPLGGAGSWKTLWATNAANNGRISIPNSQFAPSIADNDWTVGFWMKFSEVPAGAINGYLAALPNSSATGFYLGWFGNTGTNRGKIQLFTTNGLNMYSTTKILDTNWHYLAVRRINLPTVVYELYVDGVIQPPNGTSPNTTIPTSGLSLGSSSSNTTPFYVSYSNWHIGSSATLNATAISQIWTVGNTSPSTRTVKYFNGTSWVDSSAQKIYNGTSWVDWNAKRFNGTNWVVV